MLCTGQRVTEILGLSEGSYDRRLEMLDWGKTKNGQPHNLPLNPRAKAIMDALVPNKHGLYFPHRTDGRRPVSVNLPAATVSRYVATVEGLEPFTPRDIRRTWKTLAGAAGISKELRDRLQNHARSDISSKHYDRYEMMPERRAAVNVWGAYLDRILAGELDNDVVQLPRAAGV